MSIKKRIRQGQRALRVAANVEAAMGRARAGFRDDLEDVMGAEGLTSAKVARRAGLDKAYVDALLKDRRRPTFRTMAQIADGLGADLDVSVDLYKRR